jgi:hypothetical protein
MHWMISSTRRTEQVDNAVGQVLTSSIPVSFDAMAQPVQAGGIRLFAGARSDPFFADIEGALHGFAWTGHDDFAGTTSCRSRWRCPTTCSAPTR